MQILTIKQKHSARFINPPTGASLENYQRKTTKQRLQNTITHNPNGIHAADVRIVSEGTLNKQGIPGELPLFIATPIGSHFVKF